MSYSRYRRAYARKLEKRNEDINYYKNTCDPKEIEYALSSAKDIPNIGIVQNTMVSNKQLEKFTSSRRYSIIKLLLKRKDLSLDNINKIFKNKYISIKVIFSLFELSDNNFDRYINPFVYKLSIEEFKILYKRSRECDALDQFSYIKNLLKKDDKISEDIKDILTIEDILE